MSIFTNPAASSKEDAAAYTAALLDLLGAREPLQQLEQTPAVMRSAVANVQASRLSAPEAPGKWSVRQVVAHVADSEVVFAWRLRLILAQDKPPIQGYDQDAWAQRLAYDEAELDQSLAVFAALRAWNLRLIKRASAGELQRVGVHSERGEESIAHLLKLYAAHDLLHLNQIKRILESISA
ncbi:MAG TPA: DinB family protein [Longimicrobiales bacterium]